MVKSIFSNQVALFQKWLDSNIMNFKYAPYIIDEKYDRSSFKFQGLTDEITLNVSDNNIDIIVEYPEKSVFDMLYNWEVETCQSADNRFYCGLCKQPQYYSSKEDLLQEHSFEELLKWVNVFTIHHHLFLLGKIKDGKFTFSAVEIIDVSDKSKILPEEYLIKRIPVVSGS